VSAHLCSKAGGTILSGWILGTESLAQYEGRCVELNIDK